jgi:hypothetical protein
MSVWVSAILAHNWTSFYKKTIQEIAHAVSRQTTPIKWLQHPSLKSPEEEFEAEGTVSFFLPGDFHVWYGKKILCLEHTDRWSTFLINEESRYHFLSACKAAADLAETKEILLLPEGTSLMDVYYGKAGFEDCRHSANQIWGTPDLEIDRIYSTEEIQRMPHNRVHYFLIHAASIERVTDKINRAS